MGGYGLFVRLSLLMIVVGTSEAQVRLVDNGYEGLKVIIKDTVKEDTELIGRIKEVFTDASALLFRATQYRAYFRNITIVVPKKWAKQSSYELVPAVNVFHEHVRVDRKNKAKGIKPYVRGNLECGRPGWFLHVTPKFLKKQSKTKFGEHERVLVHEWGHLRWGLFDEYGSILAPNATNPNKKINFYNEGGKWKPVACTADLEGEAMTSCKKGKGKVCDVKRLQMPGRCEFCPNRKQKSIRASLMGHQWISTIDSFCDKDANSTPVEHRHNSHAPNLQNKMCGGRSAWEVMREHDDFRDNNNPSAPNDTDTTPYFTVVQETGRVRVLVFDISGSMKGQKIVQQKRAAQMAISTLIEKGSMLGMVTFNENSKTVAPLTEVKNNKVRRDLSDKVPDTCGGGTNIYVGLAKATKILQDSGVPTHGAEILLLTDGESQHPYLNIRPKLKEMGITVNTIAITNEADSTMATLARDTDGRSFTYLETDTVSFADVFGQAIDIGNNDHDKAEKIFSTTTEIQDGTSGPLTFNIDDGLGNQTFVSVFLNASVDATLRLTRGGMLYGEAQEVGDSLELELLDVQLEHGEYTLEILTPDYNDTLSVLVTVTSRPVSEEVDVIRVTSHLSHDKLDFSNHGEELKLYANVEKGGNPVLNATVTVVLAGEATFSPVRVDLHDTGTGADAVANDGIYSTYLIRKYFQGNSRYNAKVLVTGEGGAFTYVSELSAGGMASVIPGEEDDEDLEYEPVPLDNFYRQSLPGEITVVNFNQTTSGVDQTAPSKISDLSVDSMQYHRNDVEKSILYTVSWTAVGDDMEVGQASEYYFRMHEDIETLRNSFETTRLVPAKLSKPSVSGEREEFTFTLSERHCNGTCFLGLKVKDASGLLSELSNVVSVDVNFSYKTGEPEELTNNNKANTLRIADVLHVLGMIITTCLLTHKH